MTIEFLSLIKSFASRSKFVERDICGTSIKFYPISPGDLFLMRSVSASLADALGLLFTARGSKATARDSGSLFRTVKEGDATVQENQVDAISKEMAELRTEQATKAYKQLSDLILNRENMEIIARMILSSMRAKDKDDPMAVAQLLEQDISVVKDMLKGMLDASSEAMGQLGKDIGRVLKEGVAPQDQPLEEEEEESEEEQPTMRSVPPSPLK
jgi:hypothetical protein